MSGLVVKGALIEYPRSFLPPNTPNVIVFQYNPEKMTHTWTQPEPAPAASMAGTQGSNPLAVKGMPGETFSFTLAMDANDTIADGMPPEAAEVAQESGIYSRLAALEMLLYPTINTQAALTGSVSAAVAAEMAGQSPGAKSAVPQAVMPVTLFVWGDTRYVPVRVTQLTITETLYDATLNPTHAEAQITLRVLTPAELVSAEADNDVLGQLATAAYSYTLQQRQQLALDNLVNRANSVTGVLPG